MANAKGTVMIEAVKALLPYRDKALPLLGKLAHYLDDRIVLASWYRSRTRAAGRSARARRWVATRRAPHDQN
jgi:hypothetical protein